MKLAIILLFISCVLYFSPIELTFVDELDGTADFWRLLKFISFLTMIISFIVIVVLW